jgi:hypothetical protein
MVQGLALREPSEEDGGLNNTSRTLRTGFSSHAPRDETTHRQGRKRLCIIKVVETKEAKRRPKGPKGDTFRLPSGGGSAVQFS